MTNELLDIDLPKKEEVEEMNSDELQDLIKYLKELNHALGNGTMTAVKGWKKEYQNMIKLAGELDANLKQ